MTSSERESRLPPTVVALPRKRGRRWLRYVMLSGVIVLLALVILDHWLPYMLLSHYKFSVDPHPAILDEHKASCEPIEFTTSDGLVIRGWFIPATVRTDRASPTIIVLHTLGGTRADMLTFSLPLAREGFNLALIDMRGHGESGGEFFTYGYHEWRDVQGLLDWLGQRKDRAGESVAILGASAGGVVAIHSAAHDRRIKALITIGAFADLERIAEHQASWLPSWWLRRTLRKAEVLGAFSVAETSPSEKIRAVVYPTLIAHGDADVFVPFEDGKALFSFAGVDHKVFYAIPGADHVRMFADGDALRKRIAELVREACASSSQDGGL